MNDVSVNQLESPVRSSLRTLLTTISAWLPKLVAALVALLIAHVIARVIARLIERALAATSLNKMVHENMGGQYIARAVPNPSRFVSKIAYWLLFLFGVSVTISILGIPALNNIVQAIYGYIPRIIAAIAIFVVAGAISAAISGLVLRLMGGTATGKIIATAAPAITMSVAVFMILDQLKIAPTIVTITYAALLGSVALGLALAFGLGGRDVARTMLQNMYESGQSQKDRVQRELRVGQQNARREASNIRRRAHSAA